MQYLTIIRKADFIDLFKYGHLYVRRVTAFEGKISELKDNVEKFEEVTADVNPFEYSFEYLMLHVNCEQEISFKSEIELSDVKGIYVFNEEAKKEMSISFDARIQLHVSDWAPLFNKLQEKLFQKQSMRGVENLWKIFKLKEDDKTKCSRIIDNQIISEAFRELYAYERPQGELSPWVYLLRYERHSLYPRSKSGFFCDFIHVYINWMQRKEIPGDIAESTELYKQLNKEKFVDLVHVVEQSPLSQKCKEEISGCNFYIVAPLFLYLKSLSGDNLEWNNEVEIIVNYSKEHYGFDFAIATYLLGITLGYNGTYDCLYNRVGLSIFKTRFTPSESIPEPKEDPVCNKFDKEKMDEKEDIRANQMCGESSSINEDSTGQVAKPQTAVVDSNDKSLTINTVGDNEAREEQVTSDVQDTSDDEITPDEHSASEEQTTTDSKSDSSDLFGGEETVLMNNGKRGNNRKELQVPKSQVENYRNQGWKKTRNKK